MCPVVATDQFIRNCEHCSAARHVVVDLLESSMLLSQLHFKLHTCAHLLLMNINTSNLFCTNGVWIDGLSKLSFKMRHRPNFVVFIMPKITHDAKWFLNMHLASFRVTIRSPHWMSNFKQEKRKVVSSTCHHLARCNNSCGKELVKMSDLSWTDVKMRGKFMILWHGILCELHKLHVA